MPICTIGIASLLILFGNMLLMYRWRTKQNLDYTYMMMYARSRGTYYVQVVCMCLRIP